MSKAFQITTRYSGILRVHEQNLFIKNYKERMVSSTAESGYYLKQLKASFEQAIIENLWDYKIADFGLYMIGNFQEGRVKHEVNYQFTYAYDPYNIRLSLNHLRATMDEEYTLDYPIKGNISKELPRAIDVYKDLLALKNKKLLEKAQEAQKDKPVKKRPKRK